MAHRRDCNKRWKTMLGNPVGRGECPTCRAMGRVNGPSIFGEKDLPIVERMYSGRGWSYDEVDN